ncbi:integration host factor subunit beta [Methylobacillus sp. Pita2]|uniref:integration host factor subunit beta n=1 Tax=Methylobacillus sp. Pita2 TaxID=3383245 RepID=UPI0038B483E0
MVRSELEEKLADRFSQDFSRESVKVASDTILKALSEQLAKGGRIEIRGFGSFSLNIRPPRVGRNPKTGASVEVPEKRVPHFKPGLEMRDRVNSHIETKEQIKIAA